MKPKLNAFLRILTVVLALAAVAFAFLLKAKMDAALTSTAWAVTDPEVKAGKEYEEIDRAHLIEPDGADMRQRKIVWSHPAYARQCCFVRNDSEIVCVSLAAEP